MKHSDNIQNQLINGIEGKGEKERNDSRITFEQT